MHLWFLLIFAFVVQENALSTTTLYLAQQSHLHVWLIHFLFVIITSFDIWLGYHFGGYIDRRFLHNSKFQKWIKKHSAWVNKPGREPLLVFTGIIDFPFLNGVIGSWLELPFKLVFITTFIGDLISYGILWAIVLGVINLSFNTYLSIIVIVSIVLGVIYFLEKIFEQKTKA